MPLPDGDIVRVFARIGVEGIRAGEWGDLPRVVAVRLLNCGYVALTDEKGVAAPEHLGHVFCC